MKPGHTLIDTSTMNTIYTIIATMITSMSRSFTAMSLSLMVSTLAGRINLCDNIGCVSCQRMKNAVFRAPRRADILRG